MRTFANPGFSLALLAGLAVIIALIAGGILLACRSSAAPLHGDPDSKSEVLLIALLVSGAFVMGMFVFYILFG